MGAMGSTAAQPLSRPRPSGAERERAAQLLRRACAEERLSVDTFSARLDLVYAARTRVELDRLLRDVPEPNLLRRGFLGAVEWLSRLSHDVGTAWRLPRTPRMILPLRSLVVIGRATDCDFVVADATVSAKHAIMTLSDGAWVLRDAGSSNGTYVNGWRVIDEVVVRPGDELTLGCSNFILATRTR
jgi:hypothetical protein